METTRRTRQTYDQVAGRFLENTADRAATRGWVERFAARLPPGSRVLDVGAGPGCDTRILRDLGFEAVALDLSLGMLRVGREDYPAPRVQADLRVLPVGDGSVAGVWANACLLHLARAELAPALGELHRVLAPGGILYTSLKLGEGEEWERRRYGSDAPRFFTYWSASELDPLLASAGFEILTASTRATERDAWLTRLSRKTEAA